MSAKSVKMYDTGDYERQVPVIGQEEWRPHFSRDYGRMIHSASFRRQQGKTQVFPGHESDFFRNRLTHSLEVAQISEGIADKINYDHKDQLGEEGKIDGRLCAAAGLVHDIGHPPFGHNGERALDEKMKKYGGFEGNAQTLRILSRLEKKAVYSELFGGDIRAGMNLCNRTLAAILKYDNEIPLERELGSKLTKGYYASESLIVADVKKKVLRGTTAPVKGEFKTVECQIMDIADDIAYSVYDLEDSFKAGFLTPAIILASDDRLLNLVAEEVTKQVKYDVTGAEVLREFVDIFGDIIPKQSKGVDPLVDFIDAIRSSHDISADNYVRTELSSQLVHEFIKGVDFTLNSGCPALSKVALRRATRFKVECLKQYTYQATIYSARVKLGEFRGTELVKEIFEALEGPKGQLLMPDDVRKLHEQSKDPAVRARTICDFVAGMTDRYAVEFWARLKSDTAESMFKPI